MSTGHAHRRDAIVAMALRLALICAIIISISARRDGQAQSLRQEPSWHKAPVGITILSSGLAVILQSDGVLVGFDTRTGKSVGTVYRMPPDYQPVEIAAARLPDGDVLCVPLYLKDAAASNLLVQHWMSGKDVRTPLPGPGPFVGVAPDLRNRIVYLTQPSTSSIFTVPLGVEASSAKLLTRLPSSAKPGSAVLDTTREQLIVSDRENGAFYAVDVKSLKSRTLLALEGAEVRALAFDARQRRVYAADASEEVVWLVDLASTVPRKRIFAALKEFRDPAGVAIDQAGRVWVADEGASAVFVLSVTGDKVELVLRW